MGHGLDALFMCTISWSLLDQTCQNVFFFRSREDDVSDTIEEDVNVMVNDVYDNIATPFRDNMSNQVSLLGIECKSLNQPPDRVAFGTWEGIGGAVSGFSLPSYVAGVISFHTGFTGRRAHGRSYLPGIPQDRQDGNDLNGTGQTTLQNTANHILSRYGRDGSSHRWYLVVFSKANGASRSIIPPPPHIVYDVLAGIPIRHADARSRLYTQRHRLAGRGT